MDEPYILCGLGRVGARVLEYLQEAGLPVVVVDNHCEAGDARLGTARLVQGDCRREEVLREAGVEQARGVLILTSADLLNVSTALLVRKLNREVRVVIRVFNQNLIGRLGKAVHNVAALSTSTLTAPLLALTALTGQAIGTFCLDGESQQRRQVADLAITPASPLCGQTVSQVLARYDAQVLVHFRADGSERFLLDLEPGAVLRPGDRLVVCSEPQRLADLLAEGTGEVLPHLLWAGWLRRNVRMVWRTVSEVELPVKIATGVLVGVIVVSTLTFHIGVHKYGLVDALYHTISIMATGADMHAEDFDSPWQKVFASALRVLGAALTAAFTAILANYLLRARLGGALEVRRIPDGGHVIVCGLGNIGFRVVEELMRCDERVVVIEQSRDGRFVATARRLGAAVIIGDATVREVLRQANVGTARAVVVATSDDLINIEVALLVRDLDPEKRVVLRLSDPNLARSLREAANVRLALSVPVLAAPAFVAALYNDRVQSVFQIGGRLLAVVEVTVQPQDVSLIGLSVRALSVDFRLLPLALVREGRVLRPAPLQERLRPGDRLTTIAGLPELERLLRREAVRRDCTVEVLGLPHPARPAVEQWLRDCRGLSSEGIAQALECLPASVGGDLTRGQAEELLALLQQERVPARLRQRDGQTAAST